MSLLCQVLERLEKSPHCPMMLHFPCQAHRFEGTKKKPLWWWFEQTGCPGPFLFHCSKIARPNQPVPCTGKVIKLVPMRVSSLIMPAPDILLTPLSHYQSWKTYRPTPYLTLLTVRAAEWRILISLAIQPCVMMII